VTLYIGKAGSQVQNATLQRRIKAFLDFGGGQPVAHWGGRLIWQLQNSDSLLICWKETPTGNPRAFEKSLIEQFKRTHGGRKPFANLQG